MLIYPALAVSSYSARLNTICQPNTRQEKYTIRLEKDLTYTISCVMLAPVSGTGSQYSGTGFTPGDAGSQPKPDQATIRNPTSAAVGSDAYPEEPCRPSCARIHGNEVSGTPRTGRRTPGSAAPSIFTGPATSGLRPACYTRRGWAVPRPRPAGPARGATGRSHPAGDSHGWRRTFAGVSRAGGGPD